jgi:branched-chain amino acid transport system substrate-binding protein
MRARLALYAAVLLTLALGVASAAEPAEFHIGVVASVTGPFAAPTKDTFDGFNAWLKQQGLPDKKVVLQTLDDETNPVNAANAYRKLASDPQIALIYLFINSNSAMAAKSFASEFKVPIITGGGADVLGVPADPWMFKVAPSNRDYMVALSEYIKRKGYTKIAHLYSTDTFGQYDHSNLEKLAPQYGYTLVANESFAIEDTSFNAQLTRIRAANPDLIYSSASARAAILAFKQYKQLGLTTPLVVAGSAISEAFFNAIGGPAAADGLMMMTQRGSLGEGLGGDSAKYYAELKEGMGGRAPVFFNVFGFDVGLITAAAVTQSDGSRQGIRDALEKLKDLPAINGPVTYTTQDHTGQDSRSITLGKLQNGKPVPAD